MQWLSPTPNPFTSALTQSWHRILGNAFAVASLSTFVEALAFSLRVRNPRIVREGITGVLNAVVMSAVSLRVCLRAGLFGILQDPGIMNVWQPARMPLDPDSAYDFATYKRALEFNLGYNLWETAWSLRQRQLLYAVHHLIVMGSHLPVLGTGIDPLTAMVFSSSCFLVEISAIFVNLRHALSGILVKHHPLWYIVTLVFQITHLVRMPFLIYLCARQHKKLKASDDRCCYPKRIALTGTSGIAMLYVAFTVIMKRRPGGMAGMRSFSYAGSST